ncbi:MAG: glucose-6-phosphate dehydrogenase [Bacteroidales bacterium]|nr:glucose-6-phosphate dehydrogenase [Bacteroidales bacterium]
MNKVDSQLLVIFGASGDLTARKLLPGVFVLHQKLLLPHNFCILGAARTQHTDEEYRLLMKDHLLEELKDKICSPALVDSFLKRVFYLSFDSNDSSDYAKLKEKIDILQQQKKLEDRILYYLATPPIMYERIPTFLKENGLNVTKTHDGWRRIIVEKPFGTSLDSAQRLNKHLSRIFQEKQIYRIDHYLGKETVQNILVLRFSNGIFEPLWNRNYIDSVEISATEKLGVEKRGKYYDGAGALRDMIQNHLMQLMAFAAMEPPSSFDPERIRDEIVKVFRSLHAYSEKEMNSLIVRGQYQGYRNEPDVSPTSNTETYVAMKMYIDNWRWSGVPFYIVTGKKMSEKASEITINFKSTPQQLFIGQCSGSSCNKLVIRIQPDESISIKFGLKVPGAGFTVRQVGMDFRYDSLSSESLPDAYERLLLDAMLGDSTLYARSDALEASWSIIDPILKYWQENGEKGIFSYDEGEDGPTERRTLSIPKETWTCELNNK